MKNFFRKLLFFSLFTTPVFVSAFTLTGSNFSDIIYEILSVIDILIPILIALSFLVFFWGLTKFILHSGSQTDIDKGKSYMFWGVLALFVLITFRTIIALIGGDLGVGGSDTIPILRTDAVSPTTSGKCVQCTN